MSKVEKLQAFAGNINASIGLRTGGQGPSIAPAAIPAKEVGVTRSRDSMEIEVERIIPDPDQPRKEFEPDALARLAESLKSRGQLQPITVRWDAGFERYVVLTGERRWRAAQLGGLTKLRCVVRSDVLDASDRLVDQLVENCLREDLTPMEQARAYRSLMDAKGWTVRKLAEELAISPGRVSQTTALLSLPESVQVQVDEGGLSSTAAYQISKVDDQAEQVRLAEATVKQGLTRADVSRVTKASPRKKASKPAPKKLRPVQIFREAGYKVTVERKAGVDPREAAAALQAVAASLLAELEGESQAA